MALASELRRKFRVMTIKHGSHAADLDHRGKDSWRHWHEGKAERVLIESPGARVLFERTDHEDDPMALARRYLDGADIVLVEGFSAHPLPKIEVFRTVLRRRAALRPGARQRRPVGRDRDGPTTFRAACRVLRFRDTMWLVAARQPRVGPRPDPAGP